MRLAVRVTDFQSISSLEAPLPSMARRFSGITEVFTSASALSQSFMASPSHLPRSS
jgi:hypothetical protein